MLHHLYDPAFVLGLTAGLVAGGTAVAGLIHAGWAAHERRVALETARVQANVRAAESARAWHAASAANDDRARTPRAQMRGGPR